MQAPLNLPPFRVKLKAGAIWDPLRKKYVPNDPEEWVRQHFIHFLIHHLNYPAGRMASEHALDYYGQKKRCDIVVFDKNLKSSVIVECKAPTVKISEDTFLQIAKYAHVLKAKLLIMTNGMEHFAAQIKNDGNLVFLQDIPDYSAVEAKD